jgi:hypothetical protein
MFTTNDNGSIAPPSSAMNVVAFVYLYTTVTMFVGPKHVAWQSFKNHHHHLHGLGHTWSIPSSWRVFWSLHLNCGLPIFRFLFGLYIDIHVPISYLLNCNLLIVVSKVPIFTLIYSYVHNGMPNTKIKIVETYFTDRTDFVIVRYSATSSGLPSKKSISFLR